MQKTLAQLKNKASVENKSNNQVIELEKLLAEA